MLNLSDFILKPAYFDHDSKLHGITHTYRVMAFTYMLGNRLNLSKNRDLAFMAAFIHDMSRKHDGFCTNHGKWAAKNKLPVFKDLFIKNGATPEDLNEIAYAVHYHSRMTQPGKNNPFYHTLALLKDADALDRIRISPYNLNPRMLRFSESRSMIKIAEQLYYYSLSVTSPTLNHFLEKLECFHQ